MAVDLSNFTTSLFYWTEEPTSSQRIKWQIPLHGRGPYRNRPDKVCRPYLTYGIIFGLVDVCMSDYFQMMSADGDRTMTCGKPFKLSVNYCRTNRRKKTF